MTSTIAYTIGGIFGMFAFSAVVFFVLRKAFPSHLGWLAVGVSPLIIYVLGAWGSWDSASPDLRISTIPWLLGGLLFAGIFALRQKVNQARALAVTFVGIVGTYVGIGVDAGIASAKAAGVQGCTSSFHQSLPRINADYSEVNMYCQCSVEAMMDPKSCRAFSLLWSNRATETCMAKAMEGITRGGAETERFLEKKDACARVALAKHRTEYVAMLNAAYQTERVKATLALPIWSTIDAPALAKEQYAKCEAAEVLRTCAEQTEPGYRKCLSSTDPTSGPAAEACVPALKAAVASSARLATGQ